MKRSTEVKFPYSMQLFRFCQKVLARHREGKTHDQEIGFILKLNPSDCSHWKRGEKNVCSIRSLTVLAKALDVDLSIVHDIACGQLDFNEGYYEYQMTQNLRKLRNKNKLINEMELLQTKVRTVKFVRALHKQAGISVAPIYLPEIFKLFTFITLSPVDIVDKLSRMLRVKSDRYAIQFRDGDLKPQVRMSIIRNLAHIIFEGERGRFPELGDCNKELTAYEQYSFVAELLAPEALIQKELKKISTKQNVIPELSHLFWVPKLLINYQLQNMIVFPVATEEQKFSPMENLGLQPQHPLFNKPVKNHHPQMSH